VADALGVDRDADLKGLEVTVQFVYIEGQPTVRGSVVVFRSLTQGDFAGLNLIDPPPHNAFAGPLAKVRGGLKTLEDRKGKVVGFPSDFEEDGVWADIIVKGIQTNDLIHVESVDTQFEIAPGFSGSPVWLSGLDVAIGLVRRDDAASTAAFVIAADSIVGWWPGGKVTPVRSRVIPAETEPDQIHRRVVKMVIAVAGVLAVLGGTLFGFQTFAYREREAARESLERLLDTIESAPSTRTQNLKELSGRRLRFGLESYATSRLLALVRREHSRDTVCRAAGSVDRQSVAAVSAIFATVRKVQANAERDRSLIQGFSELLVEWFSPSSVGSKQEKSLAETELGGADMRGLRLTGASFTHACLIGAHLEGARLDSASFAGARLDDASFAGDTLDYASFASDTTESASFEGAKGSHANFTGAVMRGADFSGATLTHAVMNSADLSCALFGDAILDGASFEFADARWTYFGHASLGNVSHLSKVQCANFETPVASSAAAIRIALANGAVMPVDKAKIEWIRARDRHAKPSGLCMASPP
jgi:uncharacterized protein YjbI with pentapeptide repeats